MAMECGDLSFQPTDESPHSKVRQFRSYVRIVVMAAQSVVRIRTVMVAEILIW